MPDVSMFWLVMFFPMEVKSKTRKWNFGFLNHSLAHQFQSFLMCFVFFWRRRSTLMQSHLLFKTSSKIPTSSNHLLQYCFKFNWRKIEVNSSTSSTHKLIWTTLKKALEGNKHKTKMCKMCKVMEMPTMSECSSFSTDSSPATKGILRVKSNDDMATLPASLSNLDDDCSGHSDCTSSSCSSTSSNSVRFRNVQIREYGIVLGDNPSCSKGPPVSLGWEYDQEGQQEVLVDVYEKWRVGQRRSMHEMRLPAEVRFGMLREWDVQTRDMKTTESELKEIKTQRLRTLVKVQRKESMKQFTKKLKRTVSFNRLKSDI